MRGKRKEPLSFLLSFRLLVQSFEGDQGRRRWVCVCSQRGGAERKHARAQIALRLTSFPSLILAHLPGVVGDGDAYLQLPEVVGVPGPVHLCEEIMVQHLAEQLEEVHLHLVEALILQQLVQFGLPFLVVERGEKLANKGRHLAAGGAAAGRGAGTSGADVAAAGRAPALTELEVLL